MPQPFSWHLDAARGPSLPLGIHSQSRVASSMRAGNVARAKPLRRVTETLATGAGNFNESDVWLFGAETLALVDALVDARLEGLYPDGDWRL